MQVPATLFSGTLQKGTFNHRPVSRETFEAAREKVEAELAPGTVITVHDTHPADSAHVSVTADIGSTGSEQPVAQVTRQYPKGILSILDEPKVNQCVTELVDDAITRSKQLELMA